MSIHDRITLAERKRHVCLAFQKEKHGTCLKQKKTREKCNNINNLLHPKPDIHVYIHTRASAHTFDSLSYVSLISNVEITV